ncbi:YegP family protein [Duganella rhizosphaerae]|uniref:YegP family protein n=1 Tax=Duganella rhizosphaerae TaxID=2885763 RepID=UPI00403F29C7
MWFELFQDSCQFAPHPWRWRLRRKSGEVIATSSSGYAGEIECRDAISALVRILSETPVTTRMRSLAIDLSAEKQC